MKYILKIRIPNDKGNAMVKDPQFDSKMKELFTEVKAEAVYFTPISGSRGCYVVVNVNDASEIPVIAEPFYDWLQADIEFLPVMTFEDLGKAGPGIRAATAKWGN